MPISRVGYATGTTTAALPAHQPGDIILVFAFRDGSATAPSLPASPAYQSAGTRSGTSCSCRVGYRVATSSSETAGTWTNATSVIAVVYRATYGVAVGAVASNAGTTNTLNYPALPLQDGSGTSWVAGFVGHRSTNQAIETAPSGMTAVADVVDTTDEAAAHDTNAGVATWPSTNQTLAGTASGWTSFVVELRALPLVSASASQSISIGQSAATTSLGIIPWTPANLDAQPAAWVHAPDAVWSGGNLTSLAGLSITGTPTQGANQNGIAPIRLQSGAAVSKTVSLTSGTLYYFWIGARLTTSGDCALLGYNWSASGISGYIATATTGSFQAGNGWGSAAPSFSTAANAVSDTAWHSMSVQLGSSNALWVDAVATSIINSAAGALPSRSSISMMVGWNGYLAEYSNCDFGAFLILDYVPSVDDRHRIEGYYHHLFGVQSLLPSDHPYKSAPPTISIAPISASAVASVVLGQDAAADVSVAAQADQQIGTSQDAVAQSSSTTSLIAAQQVSIGQSAASALHVNGASIQTLAVSQTAAASVPVQGSAAQQIVAAQSSAGAVLVAAQASGATALGQAASAAAMISAAAAEQVLLAQGAAAAALVRGLADQLVAAQQQTAAQAIVAGTAAQSVAAGQSAAAAARITGTVVATLSAQQYASARILVAAAATDQCEVRQSAILSIMASTEATADQALSIDQVLSAVVAIAGCCDQGMAAWNNASLQVKVGFEGAQSISVAQDAVVTIWWPPKVSVVTITGRRIILTFLGQEVVPRIRGQRRRVTITGQRRQTMCSGHLTVPQITGRQ